MSAPAARASSASASSCTSTSASIWRWRGQVQELRELARREGTDDQQQSVGSHEPGVADVGGADREVLSQYREVHRGAGLGQVVGRPAKELLVGQHGQARRAGPA